MKPRQPYPTDLTDEQWKLLKPMLPPDKPRGRKRQVDLREIINAILYLLRTGCSWRMLPHDLPPWQTVYGYFNQWRHSELFAHINTTLREQVRRTEGRHETPSAAIIDSQSVKTTEQGGDRGEACPELDSGMPARRSKGANAILSLTRWDYCC